MTVPNYSGHATVLLTGCTMIGNTATQGGGAFHSNRFGLPNSALTNCLITGNTVSSAVVNVSSWDIEVTNCTIWANTDSGVFGRVDMDNSIVWGNGDGSEEAQVFPTPPFINDVAYSCIESCSGSGFCGDPTNTGADPLFTDRNGFDMMPGTPDDNLRPRAGAPVNDAGDNTSPGLVGINTDLDGNPRFVDDLPAADVGNGDSPFVDMGAYEFQAISSCPEDLDDNGDVGAFDLAILLGNWGPNPGHPADLDGDGVVGPFDLALLLGAWGPCDDACGISGDCCDVHVGTGCDDTPCCASVCELDPFCCDEEGEWDANCAEASWVSCTICDSDCCVAHGTAGCDNSICEAIVCAIFGAQSCCTNQWVQGCADLAEDNCVGLCSP